MNPSKISKCEFAKETPLDSSVSLCIVGEFGGTPSADDCMSCDQYSGPDRGMGDKVERVLKKTGVHQAVKRVTKGGCGCSKRRTALNQMLPSKDKS